MVLIMTTTGFVSFERREDAGVARTAMHDAEIDGYR
jgi:hypothetical protein